MEMYSVSVRNSEAHLIQGAEPNPRLTSPPLESFHTMYNKGGPDFVVEHGLYYPIATNYGYISTGFELPGYGDDRHGFFGLDGQEVQYSGSQTESLPYVYYSPSYGYTQSLYNPYNPYIPGALLGVDDAFTGRQQYYTIPSYKTPMSSPARYPTVFQYGPEIISSNGAESFLDTGSYSANRVGGPGVENNFPSAPATLLTVPRPASNQTGFIATASAGSKTNAGPSKLPAAPGNSGNFSSLASSYAVQASVENIRSKFYYGRVSNDVNGSSDALTEQNRGPRSNQSKTHLAVKAYTSRGGESYAQGNTSIYPDQYNMDDFPVDYGNAKFFVIKSYSEDDVHKGIKYSVWSSTPNGNKKLQSAYEDARRIAVVETRGCPIFMFFSVNASGQFCCVAEMTGPVDFHMDMDFWQQDKWTGSFPVKWHFIKDVPNPNFRHIILENNENRPVTYSRDTQEIKYKQGIEMLKIFKNYKWKTSLLDDFMYYENRQKIMQEERSGLLIKSCYGSSALIPPLDPPRKHNFLFDTTCRVEQKTAKPSELNSLNSDISSLSIAEHIVDEPRDDYTSSIKSGSLTICPPKDVVFRTEATSNLATVADTKAHDIVTVGSMPVRVDGYYSNGVLAVGTIIISPKDETQH